MHISLGVRLNTDSFYSDIAEDPRCEAGYPADVQAGTKADVLGQKFQSGELGPRNAGKTSTCVGADIHDPKARASITQGEKNFGLIASSSKSVFFARKATLVLHDGWPSAMPTSWITLPIQIFGGN